MQKYGVVKMRILRDERGFTLVEVMIALGILAIGVMSLYTMQVRAIHGNSTANGFSNLTVANIDRIERLYNADYDDSVLASGDHNATDAGITVTWSVVDDNPIPGCKRVTVTANKTVAGAPRRMTVSFIKSEIQE